MTPLLALAALLMMQSGASVTIDAGPDPVMCEIHAGPNQSVHPEAVLRATSDLGVVEWDGVEGAEVENFVTYLVEASGVLTVEVVPGPDGLSSLPLTVECVAPVPAPTTTTTAAPEPAETTTTTQVPESTTTTQAPATATTQPDPPQLAVTGLSAGWFVLVGFLSLCLGVALVLMRGD